MPIFAIGQRTYRKTIQLRNKASPNVVNGRSDPVPGDRLLLIVLVVLIVGTPTVFLRTVMLSFTIPQITFLWVAAVLVLALVLYRIAVGGELDRGPMPYLVAASSFAVGLVLTTIVSSQPWVAFTGLPARGAGAFTYLLCLVVLHAVYGLTRRRSSEPLVLAFVATHALIVFYALLQAYGVDPVTWGADLTHIGVLVFSTMGQANFSSGYVGLTLPLLVWVGFGSPYPPAARVAGGAAVGASVVALVYFGSFQGYVAAMVAVVVLLQWAITRDRGDRLVAVLVVLPVAAAIAGLPLVLTAPGLALLFGVMAATAVCAGLGVLYDRQRVNRTSDATDEATSSRFWPTCFAGLMAAGVLGVLFRKRIVDEIASGLEQRAEFWRASLSIFRERPLTGRGLETYSSYFAAHRSVEHAVQWESLVVDSPHSVPLGILSGGGLVLACTYLAVLLVVGYFGLLAVRKADGTARLLYGAVLASWFGYHVQASVSMDVPGLIYTQWVLGGILIAGGAPALQTVLVLPWKPRRRRFRTGIGALGLRPLMAISGLVVAFLFAIGPLSAPLRANMAVYRAQVALAAADPRTVEIELARAIELQPRYGYYAEAMAFLYQQGGFYEVAYSEMDRSARLQPGIPYIALKAARAAVEAGSQDAHNPQFGLDAAILEIEKDYLDAAEYWYERALESDPYGVTAITESARFYARTDRPARAASLMEEFESLRSTDIALWKAAEETYLILGDEIRAERATECYCTCGSLTPSDC